jgi:hypothetical protein
MAHFCSAQAVHDLEASLAEERAQSDSRLSKLRAELSAVRSEATARMRDLEGQVLAHAPLFPLWVMLTWANIS